MTTHSPSNPVIALGPALSGVGSWEWVGVDLATELRKYFDVVTFRDAVPRCDCVILVKYKPAANELIALAKQVPVLFCPIDLYGSSADIDADAEMLWSCARIVLHTEQLRKYFQSYAKVEVVDHHVKYLAPMGNYRPAGHILWVGMRRNLPPLVDWVNANPLPAALEILTNLDHAEVSADPRTFGFRDSKDIVISRWSPVAHREFTATARAAIDIKGDDFRQRHKPPAKAVDFLASGLPIAMNMESSSAAYLCNRGFRVAAPNDPERWLSREYWEETNKLGTVLREELSLRQIGLRFRQILTDVMEERKQA